MYTIVGIEKKEGVYEGKSYANTILHVTYTKENADGLCVTTLKVKSALCPIVEIGDVVSVLYDRYGNIAQVSVL